MYNKYKPTGWTNESHRHSLAAKGVKTTTYRKEWEKFQDDKYKKYRDSLRDYAKKESNSNVIKCVHCGATLGEGDAYDLYQRHIWSCKSKIAQDYRRAKDDDIANNDVDYAYPTKEEFEKRATGVLKVASDEQKKVFNDFQSGTERLFLHYLGDKKITKESIDDTLQIMVNSVEGDVTQLESEHEKYARKKGWLKGFVSPNFARRQSKKIYKFDNKTRTYELEETVRYPEGMSMTEGIIKGFRKGGKVYVQDAYDGEHHVVDAYYINKIKKEW